MQTFMPPPHETAKLQHQYKDAGNLAARLAIHETYSLNPESWKEWVFRHMAARLGSTARILELGCGTADLWRVNRDVTPSGWQVTLTDWSTGMLDEARRTLGVDVERFTLQVVDAHTLPFADASFDAVIANHMLYHVPDRVRTFAEIERVLTPRGHFFAATNGDDHLREFRDPELDVILFGAPRAAPEFVWFSLDNGRNDLAAAFDGIECIRFPDGLAVTDVEALVRYHGSYVEMTPARAAAIRSYYAAELAARGHVTITKSVGLFVSRRRPLECLGSL